MKWLKDLVSPRTRAWEEFYRNRWQHDTVVRSTHGVNCTGGCTWNIFVKEGIVTWEMQALDYPALDPALPPYEPRGCQRGISFSWYLYSPIRIKYPYVRGALLDLWRAARTQHDDPVAAWQSIQDDPEKRRRYQRARGKGGFRRVAMEEALEICAASNISTIKRYGPDRLIGFSPIPAMSQLSYAAGARFLQLMGGVCLSFYDWYSDLPPASPEIWGEQTDVAESADWYNAKMIAVMGANLNMTRTPDVHYVAEARHNGTKLVVLSPDFSQVSKYADQWIPLHAGQDGAFWMAVGHVILKDFYVENQTESFAQYIKQYTDAPFLVELEKSARGYRAGKLLRAQELTDYQDQENGAWKFLMWDENDEAPRMPAGSVGHRWQSEPGQWNLKLEDPTTGKPIAPTLSLLGRQDERAPVEFDAYESQTVALREVPAKRLSTANGREVLVTTAFDLLVARYGVKRDGLAGEYAADVNDAEATYTPAWQEPFTGIDRKTVIGFAREWARTAERTRGRCSIIIGAGINHWYHNNLMYRAGIAALMLTGCIGKNGGGLNHYVGQEKVAPIASWAPVAFGRDWAGPPRLMNAPSFHYMHSDQWRYEGPFTEYHPVPEGGTLAQGHTADLQVKAVRNGWLPFFPQFSESSLELVRQARTAGAADNAAVVAHAVERLKSGDLKLSVTDPDAPENWPRVWYIWRGNALMSSAKGHEFFLRHYLGTHDNAIAREQAKDSVHEVKWRDAPQGKFDLIVDLNFRMDTSALYSDIVLPAATWYEKGDLNSTDMHSYIHPLSEAVPPAWESRSDWDLFRELARVTSRLAERHLPEPLDDLVMTPLLHDSPAEIAQEEIHDWGIEDDIELVPGRTMPNLTVVTRHYPKVHERFCALGPNIKKSGVGAHGVKMGVAEQHAELLVRGPTTEIDGERYFNLREAEDAADAVLHLAPETNGAVAVTGFQDLERKTGLALVDLAEPTAGARTSYRDLQSQPRRLLTSPCWSGLINDGRPYSAFTLQVERLVPWRTLTGRQHFYLDHQGYRDFGEQLPTYKPVPPPAQYGDLRESVEEGIQLNYLTPHGKWHIHSTYSDNHRMLTLFRGIDPLWMNEADAAAIGIVDNDWVEMHNDNGVVCTRAVVSHRIPRGICIFYHSPERTIGVPKSPLRQLKRAGGHNSLTRVRLKPLLMVGGYGQFTYHFNYWGPTGVNRETFVRVRKLDRVVY